MNTCVPSYRWAKEVKAIWDNKCAYCGKTIKLEAHHIKSRTKYPEIANDLTNGIALCHDCHLRAHGGSYYQIHLGGPNKMDREDEYYGPVIDFVESQLVVLIPKARKMDVEAHAQSKGQSINGLVNALLRADMGLTDAEWRRKELDAD